MNSEIYSILIGLILNALDLITGVISAIKQRELQSSKLRDGLFKKVGFIVCYFLGWLLDTHGSKIGFSFNAPILPAVITYVCLTEMVSIIENTAKINPDLLPDKLMKLFKIGKDDENNG